MLHQVPVMTAHEMNFFYDESLSRRTEPWATRCYRFDGAVWSRKVWASPAMKEKVHRYRAGRPVAHGFLSARRGADLYILCGWRIAHHVWMAPPHIKTLQDLKGKRVGISDFNSIRIGRSRYSSRRPFGSRPRRRMVRLGVTVDFTWTQSASGKVECAPVSPWQPKISRRKVAMRWFSGRSVSDGRPSDHCRHRNVSRRAARLGEEFSSGHDPQLLVYRDMPKNFEYVNNLEKRLRLKSPDRKTAW